MKRSQNFDHLFERFLNKESSKEELQQLYHLFGTVDEQRLRQLISEEMEHYTTVPVNEQKLAAALKSINQRIDLGQQKGLLATIKIWRVAVAIAAMLLIAAGIILWPRSPVEITTYVAFGKMQEVLLPDSSKVLLNAGSTLQYPAKFTGNRREVSLKNGEAFFEVVHKAHQPFIVQTNKAEVTVLGTSFEVVAFDKEQDVKVTVSTGKVGVIAPGHQAVILLPGQRAIIDKITENVKMTAINRSEIAPWRQQRLIFEDQLLSEVFQSLERKYNVTIQIQNERLLSERVTMHLGDQPLNDVLSALSYSKHFNYSFAPNRKSVIVN